MRFDQLSPNGRAAHPATPLPDLHAGPILHVSRRRFLQGAAGAGAFGAAASAGLFSRQGAQAAAPGLGLVVPIPYGLDFFGDGRIFHVEAPPFPGFGEDPATVYNFRGISGISFTDGLVDRTNRKTGVVETLPFIASDMRFMQGEFRGRDGHVRAGTFGFV
jgi:hypothetical protein